MPKRKKPRYCLHKATGQARVSINRETLYLGKYNSPESRARYDQLMIEWNRSHRDGAIFHLTIDELALIYLKHANGYYRKNGQPTSEVGCIRSALRPLLRLKGTKLARDLRPRDLKDVRSDMIAVNLSRYSINKHIGRIKAMYRWAVENEYTPESTWSALTALRGLKKGRSVARETALVQPVSIEHVTA